MKKFIIIFLLGLNLFASEIINLNNEEEVLNLSLKIQLPILEEIKKVESDRAEFGKQYLEMKNIELETKDRFEIRDLRLKAFDDAYKIAKEGNLAELKGKKIVYEVPIRFDEYYFDKEIFNYSEYTAYDKEVSSVDGLWRLYFFDNSYKFEFKASKENAKQFNKIVAKESLLVKLSATIDNTISVDSNVCALKLKDYKYEVFDKKGNYLTNLTEIKK